MQRRGASARIVLAFVLGTCAACGRAHVDEPLAEAAGPILPPPEVRVTPLSGRLARPDAPRVVAIGDLHGDLDHARRALHLAGAVDASDAWSGGSLVVVQTGDEIDRGEDDRGVLDAVDVWKRQAKAAGGEFIALLGNHEIMNASLDFRYVTRGGFAAFSLFAPPDPKAVAAGVDPSQAGRAAAFAPGGRYAAVLADRPLMVRVGGTVFVHGGILPQHVTYGLDRMNDEIDAWLLARQADPPARVVAEDGPVWTRAYSSTAEAPDCAALARVLSELDAKRMVVGHTVQPSGITSACDGRVWRVDVGLSRAFGGPIQVLQIAGDDVTVLRER